MEGVSRVEWKGRAGEGSVEGKSRRGNLKECEYGVQSVKGEHEEGVWTEEEELQR